MPRHLQTATNATQRVHVARARAPSGHRVVGTRTFLDTYGNHAPSYLGSSSNHDRFTYP